jgi:hypothetical protein
LYIASHGLQGYAQCLCQLLHSDGALCPDDREQGELSGIGVHGVFVPRIAGAVGL